MEAKKVTRADLNELEVGGILTYTNLPYAVADSGKTSTYTFSKISGRRFTCKTEKAGDGYTLTITRTE